MSAAAVEAEQLEVLVEAVHVRQRPHRAGLEERDPQARVALEDAVRDERGEREHLLGDEVRGVQRREVVVEAAPAARRTGTRPLMPGVDARTARRLPRGTTTAARTTSSCRRGSEPKCSGRRHTPRKPCSSTQRRASASASSASVIGSVRDAEQVRRVVRAVLGQPVVDRAAQRERRLAFGDALDHQPERRVQRGRRRCGRRPCRRAAGRARCRRAPRPASS